MSMKDIGFSVQDVKELMEAVRKNRISAFKITNGEFSLEIEGSGTGAAQTVTAAAAVISERVSAPEEAPAAPAGNIVKSPIVGTFYAAPDPDKAPFVTEGAKVNKGDVLFIIESMKLMNEVTSEYSGTVAEIFVKNSQGVEFGQPILRIE